MSKRRIHQLLSVVLCVIIAVTMVACQNAKPGTADTGTTSESTSTSDTQKPSETQVQEKEPYEITFMTRSFSQELPKSDSPVIQKIEEYTNTKLNIQWVPDSTYGDKMNIVLASGELPQIMEASKEASIINAARSGAFWEIGPYLKDYPNLSQSNEIVLNNISIDGKIYGIYRSRDLGRNGISYRTDWLENVGMTTPKTVDDFYNMLKAFTFDDPDQNGEDDTIGLVVTKWVGPWNVIQLWFGAPNEWGEDESGKLVPNFMTPEYLEGLKFCQKLYKDKLVNQDFAVMESSKWTEPYISEECGVFVDVLDFARRTQNTFEKELGYTETVWDVIGGVDAGNGLRTLPTAGYNGMNIVTKGAETEEDMKRTLDFLDKLNDTIMQDTLYYGLEGLHYNVVDGHVELIEDPEQKLSVLKNDLAQLGMNIPYTMTPQEQTEIVVKVADRMKANEPYCIGNPVLPYVSDTYTEKGPQLDKIMEDIRVKYIVGQATDDEFNDAVALWRKNGGDSIIEEYNVQYEKFGKK